jgi:hypothetical protein
MARRSGSAIQPTVGLGTNTTLWLAGDGRHDGSVFRFAMR